MYIVYFTEHHCNIFSSLKMIGFAAILQCSAQCTYASTYSLFCSEQMSLYLTLTLIEPALAGRVMDRVDVILDLIF
jgi:hypothetical protein